MMIGQTLLTILVSGISSVSVLAYTVKNDHLSLEFTERGEVSQAVVGNKKMKLPLSGAWSIGGCELKGVSVEQQDSALSITKQWVHEGREFESIETVSPEKNGINWRMDIKDGSQGFWSAPIKTEFKYPVSRDTCYWTAWSDPRQGKFQKMTKKELVEIGMLPDTENANGWADPFLTIPFQNTKLWYGEEPYILDEPFYMFGLREEQKDITCIPMLSVFEPNEDMGITIVQSIDDFLLNVSIETTEEGSIVFSRDNYRIGEGIKLGFSVDIAVHDGGLLSGLKWVAERYPAYFVPTNPEAKKIEGMWNYTRNWGDFDVEKMKRMGFKTTWKASHDFPWMGMFIPPVGDDESWQGFERNEGNENDIVSIPKMREYSDFMVKNGFCVLNYMNVCEVGAYVPEKRPVGIDEIPEMDLWKHKDAYLYRKWEGAILPRTWRDDPNGDKPDKFYSWRKCIAMDCGEISYQDFLVEQIERHIKEFPASSGFNVDRLDWLRIYNTNRDDGISWFEGKPARSLNWSYKQLMKRVWPMLQESNKYWFLDTNGARIDFMNQADGIIQENNSGQTLNCNAIMAMYKPFGAWFKDEHLLGKPNSEVEDWLQNYLYVGAWPMAPFPDNDHSLRPDPRIDRIFLEYAPLFKCLYGKQWVLESHALKKGKEARVNLFKTDAGFAIPVMMADKEKVTFQIKTKFVKNKRIYAVFPGNELPTELMGKPMGDYIEIETPVIRRCAMVVIK